MANSSAGLSIKIRFLSASLALLANSALAQAQSAEPPITTLDPVVISATRNEQKSFDLPASIDSIEADQIQDGQPRVNLSENLGRAPGLVVQNRQNYAQDLQVSARGFGARASFGVRGVRLIQDDIPLTMPDGQGQTGTFSLDTAKRIEVLRGPLAALYGNSSGGVIRVITADGPAAPTLSGTLWAGSFRSRRGEVQFGGESGPLNYIGSASRFTTDGYRDHSAATRDLANMKLRFTMEDGATLSLVGTSLHQPDTLDPLGLDRSQLDSNRRQAGTNALAFNTRKSIGHTQAGLVYERRLSPTDSIKLLTYAGERSVNQYLALPLAQQGISSSGGVVDLDRSFGGVGLQWTHDARIAGGPFTITVGADYDRMKERRRGFVNNFGVQEALRRDEDDTVWSFDQYVQSEWRFAPRWRLLGGVRHSSVSFDSRDRFIVRGASAATSNPDDSGSVRYASTNPAAGLVFELTRAVNLYVSAGRAFETPTFAELAYRSNGQPGLNFDLRPSTSRNFEVGAKMLLGSATRANVAVFRSDTANDIVTVSNVGGRSTFGNAAKTERRGVELALESDFGAGFKSYAALTWIEARFREYAASGNDFSGNKLPGVPSTSLYAELAWRHAPSGFSTAIEGRYASKIYTDDANTGVAGAYMVVNWRGGFEQRWGRWGLRHFVRIDNLFDRRYVGSVIVNAAQGRYYEPAPTRNYLVGVNASYVF